MNEIAAAGPTLAHRPSNHPHVASGAIGVLLVNLGTPDATDAKSVRRYLREFLHDKRVIEEDTITWKFVLNVIILPLRPGRKGLDYQKIWNRRRRSSALRCRGSQGSWSTGRCATAIRRCASASPR
jgi:protoporphyrin/coproporphyrin ferrochelatase